MVDTSTEANTDRRPHERSGSKSMADLPPPGEQAQLVTDSGRTRIAAGVVAKIAGYAAREIPGVYGIADRPCRPMGQLRGMVGGTANDTRQGVSVEVGEREAAVELDIVTWYGQSIVDVSNAVRRNVIDRVQANTGLTVIEVDINIDDVYVEGDQHDDDRKSPNR
jgi:uncharacterized alkaline shock family protein YloU